MDSTLSSCRLLVKKSPIHGYGVFAGQKIKPGCIIEESYVLIVDNKENDLLDFYYDNGTTSVLPLGYGGIYNHSSKPNASYKMELERSLMIFRATRLIRRGEEIFISYGKGWFSSRAEEEIVPILKSHVKYDFILLWIRFAFVTGILFALISMATHVFRR